MIAWQSSRYPAILSLLGASASRTPYYAACMTRPDGKKIPNASRLWSSVTLDRR